MIAVVVAEAMEAIAYINKYFLARNYIVESSCETEMKLILCIICGTKITISAGSSTLWHRNFVTHRETDKFCNGSFTPQDIVAQRIQQAKDQNRDRDSYIVVTPQRFLHDRLTCNFIQTDHTHQQTSQTETKELKRVKRRNILSSTLQPHCYVG